MRDLKEFHKELIHSIHQVPNFKSLQGTLPSVNIIVAPTSELGLC